MARTPWANAEVFGVPLAEVTVNVGYGQAPLKVVSSEHRDSEDELVSYAAGTVPAQLIDVFAGAGAHSISIETKNAQVVTGIRIGNTGAQPPNGR